MTNSADGCRNNMADSCRDKAVIIKRVNELAAQGRLEEAWKLVASYCAENPRDAEMLAALREVERARMRKEPSGTKLSFIQIVLNGMPFVRYSLEAIYDFAHEIIIVEGAVENCMFAANPDGSSKDGTVEFIRSLPDPENKIRFVQGRWPEKLEMTNEAIRHVTGDYVWIVDTDEVYRRDDIEKIVELITTDSSITQVGLIPYNFWKGFDYVVESERFTEHGLQFQGPMKFLPGARFVNHRPVQLKYPGYVLTADILNRIDGTETRAAGIRFCHYSYVLEQQVYQKIELYRRYGWGKGWNLDLDEWYRECFLKWTPENREQIEQQYPVWTGDRNSRTVPFSGEHPEVMLDFMADFRRRRSGASRQRPPHTDAPAQGAPATKVRSSQQILEQVIQFSRTVSTAGLIRGDVAVRINSTEFRLQRIGTEYGGWVVPVDRISGDSICYCVGAGEDVSFDVGLVTRYACDVHTFDPTPRAKAHIDLLKDRTRQGLKMGINGSDSEFYEVGSAQLDKIYFHPYGIWSDSSVQKFYAPQNPAHVSHSILNIQHTEDYFTAGCLSLCDAMGRLGHDRIDLLKIDVEGAEYAIVDSIIAGKIRVGILCLEFDELNASIDENYEQRIKDCIAKLLDADYVPLFINGGAQSDYTFVHADMCSESERPGATERCERDPAEGLLRRPKYIKTETTNVCNANCVFCAYGLMTRPKGVMAMDMFKNVVGQYAKMGGGQITISPEVGDCLVDAQLLERLRYCRRFEEITELGFHTNMIGLDRWTDEQVMEMIDLVTWWACSIGPNRDVYKDMFGVDQFERVTANLERLHQLLSRSQNKPEIKLNGRGCGGSFYVDERIARVAYELVGEPIKWMRVFGDWGGKLTTLPRNTPICRSHDGSEKRLPCMKPLISAVVFHDGKVGFCGCADYDARLLIGDVNAESLESILGSDKRREYLESFGTACLNDYCRKCTFYEPLQEDLQPLWAEHQQRYLSRSAEDAADRVTSRRSVFGLGDCVRSDATTESGPHNDIGTTAIAVSREQADLEDAAVRNVLWVRTDSIGDNILSASMLEHVRSKYPNARITVVCQEHISELYSACPYVDEVLSFNRVKALRDENYRAEVVERLRSIGPDVALNSVFSREPLTDIFTIGSLAGQRVALDGDLCNMSREVKLMYNQRYTKLLPSPGEYRHELDRHRDFLRGLGMELAHLEPVVWTDAQDEEFAQGFFDTNSLDPQRTVALFPSAQHFHKAYESYDRVAEILGDWGFKYILLGGGEEDARQRADRVRSRLCAESVDLTGLTTIRQTAEIIRRCTFYLGSDSAGAHIACAVGTPNIVILGGGHFGRFIPYSPLTSAVCLPLECYQCRWNCRYEKPHCVKDISPHVVIEAVNKMTALPAAKPRMFVQSSQSWQPSEWQPRWAFHEDYLRGRDAQIMWVDTPSFSGDDESELVQDEPGSEKEATVESIGMAACAQRAGGETQANSEVSQMSIVRHCDKNSVDGRESARQCDVSIVVCTKNRAALLDRMLHSLERAARTSTCELIVIEGGSGDNTAEVLREHRVTHLYNESEHLGNARHSWPQLYNFGFAKARGRWAMYASDDIVFSDGAVDRAVEFLDRQKDEVAGGIFFYRNSQATDPQWADYGIDITYGSKLLMNYGLVRLDYFREIGGLDEAYQFYCADTDLCYKLYERGRQLIPLPECFVLHDNVVDAQKIQNMAGADVDIELLLRRWQHFVGTDMPYPRRLLWTEDMKDAFCVPAEIETVDSSIEAYWHGLACLQQGLFHEAKDEFERAVSGGCAHRRVWLYLARAVSRSQQAEHRAESAILVL